MILFAFQTRKVKEGYIGYYNIHNYKDRSYTKQCKEKQHDTNVAAVVRSWNSPHAESTDFGSVSRFRNSLHHIDSSSFLTVDQKFYKWPIDQFTQHVHRARRCQYPPIYSQYRLYRLYCRICILFCLSLACLLSSYCTRRIGQLLALQPLLSCLLCIAKLHVVRFTFEQIKKEGRKEVRNLSEHANL